YRHGFKIIVLTNQSGVARGLFDAAALEAMHSKMAAMVEALGGKIERIYVCTHGPNDHCACRKPKPGLLRQFAHDYQVDLYGLPFIGDALRDIDAALAVGAKPVLVKTGKGRKTLIDNPDLSIPVFENLYAVAEYLVASQNS
ncbi:MAG: D-glycero-alpha-D-manno-heptose-1,7-bisphosphate 7-phosphatase, partial [Gammaproteobacteria bacterium]